jgi:hypothetical protein
VVGGLIRANTWIVATFLIAAALVLRRRYRSLIWTFPALLQMGVMIMAPANNFERHATGLFVGFAFTLVGLIIDRNLTTKYQAATPAQSQ